MTEYREVIIFTKATEFTTTKLSNGGEFTSNNAEYICNLTTRQEDDEIIAYGVKAAGKMGLELGLIQVVSTQGTGFYAGAKALEKEIYNSSI